MYETLTLAMDAHGVARVTLNRPDKHNTLSGQMIADLTAVCGRLGADREVRVVILDAAGESFCAGGDLDWMRAQIAGGPEERRAGATALAGMLGLLNRMPKPLIGRVHGAAYGGGVGMVSVCDIAIGSTGAKFGLTETRLGLIPATISPYVIARIGAAAARRHMLPSRIFGADEAARIGLLSRVVAEHDLDDAIREEADLLLQCAPGAIADAKALIRTVAPGPDDALVDRTIGLLVERWENPEASEGIDAFFDRRPPAWRT